jgi:hypothetical protein
MRDHDLVSGIYLTLAAAALVVLCSILLNLAFCVVDFDPLARSLNDASRVWVSVPRLEVQLA